MIETDGKRTVANSPAKGQPPTRGPRPGETPADTIGREAGALLAKEAKREAGER